MRSIPVFCCALLVARCTLVHCAVGGFLVNKLGSKCLDVNGVGNRGAGSPVQLWDCDTYTNTDQVWTLQPSGRIMNVLSGLCLDVCGLVAKANGARLQLWYCENANPQTTDQLWTMTATGRIVNQNSNKCLDLNGPAANYNGAPAQIWDCDPAGAQTDQEWRWKAGPQYLPSGTYYIRSVTRSEWYSPLAIFQGAPACWANILASPCASSRPTMNPFWDPWNIVAVPGSPGRYYISSASRSRYCSGSPTYLGFVSGELPACRSCNLAFTMNPDVQWSIGVRETGDYYIYRDADTTCNKGFLSVPSDCNDLADLWSNSDRNQLWQFETESSLLQKCATDINGDCPQAMPILSSWMSTLPGQLSLAALSIPGTHDSATRDVDPSVQDTGRCQDKSISGQLWDGIRYLDIRLSASAANPSDLLVFHGNDYCRHTFTDTFDAVADFLQTNSREIVLVHVKQEFPPDFLAKYSDRPRLSDADFGRTIAGQVLSGNRKFVNYLYNGTAIPSLDQARGKIVLLKRFKYDANALPGIDVSGWPDKAPGRTIMVAPGGAQWSLQDMYDSADTTRNTKLQAIKDQFNAAAAPTNPNALYINYLSYAPELRALPRAWADDINRDVVGWLRGKPRNIRWGVMVMDFYLPAQVALMILSSQSIAR